MSAVADAPAKTEAPSIGVQIDALWDLREKKRELEERLKDLHVLIEQKEGDLFDKMDEQGTSKGAGRKASVSLTTSIVPQMIEWDDYWKYIRRNNAFELLERRPAVAAWREHAAKRKDGTVPGTVPFEKRKLSLRTL